MILYFGIVDAIHGLLANSESISPLGGVRHEEKITSAHRATLLLSSLALQANEATIREIEGKR